MEWIDNGIVLALRRHGDTSGVLSALTEAHGRHAGLVRGILRPARRSALQPGNAVALRWRGRLIDHLGTLDVELHRMLSLAVWEDRARLAAVIAACTMIETATPEREPLPRVFRSTKHLIEALEGSVDWRASYVRWEVDLLAALGFGLDLSRCAVSGATKELAYVSPRSGRAVSREAAGPWRQRLLVLPAFLVDPHAEADRTALADGLRLTRHFLVRHVYAERGVRLPEVRDRLMNQLLRDLAL